MLLCEHVSKFIQIFIVGVPGTRVRLSLTPNPKQSSSDAASTVATSENVNRNFDSNVADSQQIFPSQYQQAQHTLLQQQQQQHQYPPMQHPHYSAIQHQQMGMQFDPDMQRVHQTSVEMILNSQPFHPQVLFVRHLLM